MRKTDFAGLTELDAGEPLTTDGGSFTGRDRDTIDHFLEVGAKTHRHDGHAPLANPQTPPTMGAQGAGGNLAPDTTITACYTLLDVDGGETLPSPVGSVTTPDVIDPPNAAPTATVDYTAGGLLVDTYTYAATLTDDSGGETPAGPSVTVTRQPGSLTAQVLIEDLATLVAGSDGATGWRLYRAKGDSALEFLASGDSFTDAFLDDGNTSLVYDQSPPPDNNTTNATAQVTVNVPSAAVAGSNGWRLYVAIDGDFTSPSLVGGDRPLTDAGQDIVIGELDPDPGAPPDVSTSVGGAEKILATRDIDFTGWTDPNGGGGPGGAAGPMALGDALTWNDANGQPAVQLTAVENWKQLTIDSDEFDGTNASPFGFTQENGAMHQDASTLGLGEQVGVLVNKSYFYAGQISLDFEVNADNYNSFSLGAVVGGPNPYGIFVRVHHGMAPSTIELLIRDAGGERILASDDLTTGGDGSPYDQDPSAGDQGTLSLTRNDDGTLDVWMQGFNAGGNYAAELHATLEGADLANYGTAIMLYPAVAANLVVAADAVVFPRYAQVRNVPNLELWCVMSRNGSQVASALFMSEDGIYT